MSRKFITSLSGTYNVHANELAHGGSAGNIQQDSGSSTGGMGSSLLPAAFAKLVRQSSQSQSPPPQVETIKCVVHFLDDTQHIFEVDRSAKGGDLLDLVFRHLELIEREYFALQFTETIHHHYGSTSYLNSTPSSSSQSSTSSSTTVYTRWLDSNKKIRKQMRFTSLPYLLHFRVKFYVSDVGRLFEEYTRYHYYLQLRKDILSGRLSGDESTLALLASFVLQSELGDYNEEEHQPGYGGHYRYIPNQTSHFERMVENLHRRHQGQTPAESELNYLDEAKNLELYGVDLHQAKDCENHDIQIGISSNGLTIFKQSIRVNTFSWAKIVKISFKRRFFFVQLKHEGTERFDNMIGFNLCSYRSCKSLWKACVEQHTFFRLHTPKPLTKKFFFFFSLGSKYRYSGKTEFQTIEENKKRLVRTERIFIRNNVRNATMPAFTGSTTKMNDAQKCLANLRLTNHKKNANKANGRMGSNGHMSSSSSSSFDSPPPTPPPPSLNTANGSHKSNLTLNSSSNNSTSVLTAIAASNNSYHYSSSGHPEHVPPIQPPRRKSSILSHQTGSTSRSSSISSASHHHKVVVGASSEKTSKHDLLPASTSCDNIQGYRTHVLNGRSTAVSRHTNGRSGHDSGSRQPQQQKQRHQIADDNGDIKADNQQPSQKAGSLPAVLNTSASSSTTAAYSPLTMISMPYIDQDKASSSTVTITNESYAAATSSIDEDDLTLVVQRRIEDDEEKYRKEVEKDIDSPIRELIKELYDVAATETATSAVQVVDSPEESSASSPVHLITVTMKPDQEGRFGFNVKGGFDQNCPVLVSRVAPNTPADNSHPTKLHEGDQVISINGVEVSGLRHEEVVQLIRSTKDKGPEAELLLAIRPNMFHRHQCDEVTVEEPPFQYTATEEEEEEEEEVVEEEEEEEEEVVEEEEESVIEDIAASSEDNQMSLGAVNSLLATSMELLEDGLASETLIAQFEQLYRRNEKEPISIARYMHNVHKNRYLDIAPYDSTRVILNQSVTGDYINASHVTMTVQSSGVVNRYIATQGPLKRTTSDFWLMIWEQAVSVIVMVTPLVEDGRKKCFKYWPDKNQVILVNDRLELTLETCKDETAFLERTFKLTDPDTKLSHCVTHLQYLAWPDQGVPDDDADFLKLIFRVRALRHVSPEAPLVVHCSAGIGRTGVLILMETGICLIEANQPVYPLDLVRIMRNQRASLVQTTMQFRFVCEALNRVYKNQVVTPLPQYSTSDTSGETATTHEHS